MAKRYPLLRLILPLALFVLPFLLRANGDPTGIPQNGQPTNLDSLTRILGHCNPIVQVNINCETKTILLRAFVDFTFSGQRVPIVATWNTGETAHIITVTPPGAWSWDPSGTGCETGHWENEYEASGPFFNGPLEITGPLGICPGESYELDVLNPQGSVFQNVEWGPPVNSSSLPLTISGPGTFNLSLEDEFGCPFSDQFIAPASPVVAPALLAPLAMCPENDTAFVQVAQVFNHYLWNTGDTLNPLLIQLPGTYSVTVTNNLGCTGTQEITVNSAEVQPINVDMSVPAICLGETSILTAPPGFLSYVWSNGDLGITNIVNAPGTYDVTVTNQYGCTGTGSVTIGLKPTPTIAVTTTPFCPGATSTLTATPGFPSYIWSAGGLTTNPITVSAAGTYTVTVSGVAICSVTSTVSVTQFLLPPPPSLRLRS